MDGPDAVLFLRNSFSCLLLKAAIRVNNITCFLSSCLNIHSCLLSEVGCRLHDFSSDPVMYH